MSDRPSVRLRAEYCDQGNLDQAVTSGRFSTDLEAVYMCAPLGLLPEGLGKRVRAEIPNLDQAVTSGRFSTDLKAVYMCAPLIICLMPHSLQVQGPNQDLNRPRYHVHCVHVRTSGLAALLLPSQGYPSARSPGFDL